MLFVRLFLSYSSCFSLSLTKPRFNGTSASIERNKLNLAAFQRNCRNSSNRQSTRVWLFSMRPQLETALSERVTRDKTILDA